MTTVHGQQPPKQRLGHRPVLDGLRGVAFVLVFVGHAGWLPFLRSSQTAMFLFFALSGFLITSLLVEERELTGRVRLGNFFARRALRLVPALLLLLGIWLAVVAIFSGSQWLLTAPGSHVIRGQDLSVGAALRYAGFGIAYVSNWLESSGRWGSHQPLTHLWSLAVEEQFYLVWAPLLAATTLIGRGLARRTRLEARRSAWLLLGLIAVVLTMASLAESGWDFYNLSVHSPRVAYGTDTRAGAFLLGGVSALLWSAGLSGRIAQGVTWLSGLLPRRLAKLRLPLGGLLVTTAAIALLIAGRLDGDAQGDLAKTLSFMAATLLAPLLVVSLVEVPTSTIGRVLAHPVATYLGRRSYALYLWHYLMLTWFHDLGFAGTVLALAGSLAAAELSWHLVESRALAYKDRMFGLTARAPVPAPRRYERTEVVTTAGRLRREPATSEAS